MINEDLVEVLFDDDVVELNTIEDPSIHMMTKKKKKKRSRRSVGTSKVWTCFDELP
jgi:hypothetical protein